MNRNIHPYHPGEIPEGRAESVLSLCAYAQQRTLEPELEPGVTKEPDPFGRKSLFDSPVIMPHSRPRVSRPGIRLKLTPCPR